MIIFILDKQPGVKLLAHRKDVYLTLKGSGKQFSKVVYHFIFPLAMREFSHCSTSLLTFYAINLFYFSHSKECEMTFHCSCSVLFPDD